MKSFMTTTATRHLRPVREACPTTTRSLDTDLAGTLRRKLTLSS